MVGAVTCPPHNEDRRKGECMHPEGIVGVLTYCGLRKLGVAG